MKILFLEDFGKAFIPEKFRSKLRDFLLKAGISKIPYKFFGGLFYLSIILTLMIYLNLWQYIVGSSGALVWLLSFGLWILIQGGIALLIMLIIYVYLDLLIFKRTKEIEGVLADFLEFFASNLKGGMSLDRALWRAVKPRFGVLSNEIKIAAKKVMTGGDVDEALVEFSNKYESIVVNQSFKLIVEAIKGGSRIADIIDRIVENIRATDNLKKKMSSSSATFGIFISATILVISPGLFALSYHLLLMLKSFSKNLGNTAMTANVSIPINFSELAVTPENFKIFSLLVLGIVAFFSAIIISIIKNGNIKAGVKYIPLFVFISLGMYYLFMFGLGQIFGNIIAGL